MRGNLTYVQHRLRDFWEPIGDLDGPFVVPQSALQVATAVRLCQDAANGSGMKVLLVVDYVQKYILKRK